jgi:uncharacterized protein YqgV (UPF0045/DUF77 family)
VLVAFAITPLGVGESVSEPVAAALRVVRDSGLPNRTDAMFTTVEGSWDEVMGVVRRAVDAVAAVAPRVGLVLKADLHGDIDGAGGGPGGGQLEGKVARVERLLSSPAPPETQPRH